MMLLANVVSNATRNCDKIQTGQFRGIKLAQLGQMLILKGVRKRQKGVKSAYHAQLENSS